MTDQNNASLLSQFEKESQGFLEKHWKKLFALFGLIVAAFLLNLFYQAQQEENRLARAEAIYKVEQIQDTSKKYLAYQTLLKEDWPLELKDYLKLQLIAEHQKLSAEERQKQPLDYLKVYEDLSASSVPWLQKMAQLKLIYLKYDRAQKDQDYQIILQDIARLTQSAPELYQSSLKIFRLQVLSHLQDQSLFEKEYQKLYKLAQDEYEAVSKEQSQLTQQIFKLQTSKNKDESLEQKVKKLSADLNQLYSKSNQYKSQMAQLTTLKLSLLLKEHTEKSKK